MTAQSFIIALASAFSNLRVSEQKKKALAWTMFLYVLISVCLRKQVEIIDLLQRLFASFLSPSHLFARLVTAYVVILIQLYQELVC